VRLTIFQKIKDTVPIEDDIKFTDETVDEVVGHQKTINHDIPEAEKV